MYLVKCSVFFFFHPISNIFSLLHINLIAYRPLYFQVLLNLLSLLTCKNPAVSAKHSPFKNPASITTFFAFPSNYGKGNLPWIPHPICSFSSELHPPGAHERILSNLTQATLLFFKLLLALQIGREITAFWNESNSGGSTNRKTHIDRHTHLNAFTQAMDTCHGHTCCRISTNRNIRSCVSWNFHTHTGNILISA